MATESSPLSLLLDVSTVESPTLISLRFTQIAEALLHHHYLRVEHQGTTIDFELLEVEFYLQKRDVHEDPFCHAHEDQGSTAQWYFHRVPTRNASLAQSITATRGYRGGTRKGLDLTFGAPVMSPFFRTKASAFCRGGILLRSMRLCRGNTGIISGPSLLVDKILSVTGSRDIPELVATNLGGYLSAFPPPSGDLTAWNSHPSRMYFTLRPHDSKTLSYLHRSPRVGLDLSHPSVSPRSDDSRVVYLAKLYRYFICPELLKTNGRCHTLIGLALELNLDPATCPSDDRIALTRSLVDSMSISRVTVERYLDDYVEGFKNESLIRYVGASAKGACSTPQLFMRMMGILARMGLLKASEEG